MLTPEMTLAALPSETGAASPPPVSANSPGNSQEAPAPRPGPRSRVDQDAQGYPPPRRRKDTGRWVVNYRDPITAVYRKNRPLIDPATKRPPIDQKDADRVAAILWSALTVDADRAALGLSPRKSFNPRDLLVAFIQYQRTRSTRTDTTEDAIVSAFRDLKAHTTFGKCRDLSMVHGA